ncbi:molybdopterin-dependent oxidoreductase [Pseudonocardia sp. GCM10023141]|uniref:molybdopterin-dependent oxidoreductase n=1 Tax=Pseudonocardia sp. GCM10023141 TaxID=3252653 RepID=UPI00360AAD67
MSHWGAFRPTVDRHGEVTAARGDDLDPAPSALLDNVVGSVRHPLRIPAPMVRQGWWERGPGPDAGRGAEPFVQVGWDDVLDRLAGELDRVYDGYGPAAVFGGSYGWSSAGRFHHAQSQVHRFLNCLGGYVRSVNTYSVGAAEVVLPHIFGRDADVLRSLTSWPLVAEHTDLLVCFGGVPAKNGAVAPGGVTQHRAEGHLAELARRGGRLVLISANRHDLPAELDVRWLPARPGTDTALMLALSQVLVAEDRHDTAFLATCCAGADEAIAYLCGTVDGVVKSPRWAAPICGIDEATIVELARSMAGQQTMVTVSYALQRAEFGEQPLWAAVLLAALLGRIGSPGGGFGHGYGSIGDNGFPSHSIPTPALPQLTNPVREFIPVARIADMLLDPGGEYDYNGSRLRYPRIELVYWCGGNPFHHHQDLARLRSAWRAAATIVVHETYWTASARHADVVLPATVTLERDDIGASRTDPYLTAMQHTSVPYAQARDDYAIFSDLADRLGVGKTFTDGRDPEGWLRHLYEGWREAYGPHRAPDFDSFWRAGRIAIDVPPPAVLLGDFRADPAGHPLATPSGRIELHSPTVAAFGYPDCPGHPVWLPPQEWHGSARVAAFPLVLLANNPATRLHSQLDFGPHSRAGKVAGREPVRMHQQDARQRGLTDGEVVRVFNDRGACLAGVRIDAGLVPGVVQMSTGAWFSPVDGVDPVLCAAGNVNVLTRDVGTSRLAQGCTGSRTLVQIERWYGALPAISAESAPPSGAPAERASATIAAPRPTTVPILEQIARMGGWA